MPGRFYQQSCGPWRSLPLSGPVSRQVDTEVWPSCQPIDLYVEHLVAMSTELNSERARLVPLLHLPLDSQMFDQTVVFSDAELRQAGVGRGDGYAAVTTTERYDGLQAVTVRRAEEISEATGRAFHPVYFDLIWNHRYAAWGGNLFEVNP